MSTVFQVYREIRDRAHVDDLELHLIDAAMDIVQKTKDENELFSAEKEKVKLELLFTKSGKQGNGKLEVYNPYLEEKLRWFCSAERLGLDDRIECLVVDMSTELTETWAQGDQEACHVKEVCGHCQETQSVEATVQEERRSKTRHHGVASCQDMEAQVAWRCVRRKDETSECKWLKCLDRKWWRRLAIFRG